MCRTVGCGPAARRCEQVTRQRARQRAAGVIKQLERRLERRDARCVGVAQLARVEIFSVKEERLTEVLGSPQVYVAGADAVASCAGLVASCDQTDRKVRPCLVPAVPILLRDLVADG